MKSLLRIVQCVCLLIGLTLATPIWGQVVTDAGRDAPQHDGYPVDWSSHYLVMPGGSAEKALAAGVREPRHVYNMVTRQAAIERGRRQRRSRHPIAVDWAVSLENGFVPANQYPASFGSLTAESCNGDYSLFALDVTSGTQANVVGINNLYTTAAPKCNNGAPWVAFAYNTVTQTGGKILNSPSLSADGTKAVFVESTTTGSYFHVLVLPNPIPAPPSHVGTVLNPQTPTSCAAPVTPGCMTTVKFTTANDTNSSVWIDYGTDIAYVGADNGMLYKIAPVFGGGTPQVISDTNWPVLVSASGNPVLTDPIVDDTAGRIFLGDGFGYLYALNLTAPKKVSSAQVPIGWIGHNAGTGIVDPPLVVTDPANPTTDQVFAFTGCSIVQGIGGAVTQLPANFTSSSAATNTNTVDLGSGSGNGDCTSGNVHAAIFDNEFWTNGSTSGHLMGCGFVSGTNGNPRVPSNPKMYMFPFANNVITAKGEKTFVVNNTRGDECSPLTEFFDGTTDRLFFGVGGSTDGFIESSTITTTLSTPNCGGTATSSCVKAPAALGGTSGIVIDNVVSNGGTNIYFSTLAPGSVNGQNCHVTGGTATPYCAVKLTQAGLQ